MKCEYCCNPATTVLVGRWIDHYACADHDESMLEDCIELGVSVIDFYTIGE